MRMPPNRCDVGDPAAGRVASMEGGMRMPPNYLLTWSREADGTCFNGGRHAHAAESDVQALRRRVGGASMEGGVRMPPNRRPISAEHAAAASRASMEGGMRMPPNCISRRVVSGS